MIAESIVIETIQSALGQAEVSLQDRSGESNHFLCAVKSPAFEGKTLIERHRLIRAAVKPLMADGRLHALEIKEADV